MKTANLWEHKVGNNANIANLVYLWKTRVWANFFQEELFFLILL